MPSGQKYMSGSTLLAPQTLKKNFVYFTGCFGSLYRRFVKSEGQFNIETHMYEKVLGE